MSQDVWQCTAFSCRTSRFLTSLHSTPFKRSNIPETCLLSVNEPIWRIKLQGFLQPHSTSNDNTTTEPELVVIIVWKIKLSDWLYPGKSKILRAKQENYEKLTDKWMIFVTIINSFLNSSQNDNKVKFMYENVFKSVE